jgi:hypothetical protein
MCLTIFKDTYIFNERQMWRQDKNITFLFSDRSLQTLGHLIISDTSEGEECEEFHRIRKLRETRKLVVLDPLSDWKWPPVLESLAYYSIKYIFILPKARALTRAHMLRCDRIKIDHISSLDMHARKMEKGFRGQREGRIYCSKFWWFISDPLFPIKTRSYNVIPRKWRVA